MKKYLLLFILPLISILNSCQKIEGTVLTSTNSTSATYQPLTSGSTWTYRTDYTPSGFAFIDTAIIVMSPKTYTINSRVYQQAYSHGPSAPSLVDTGYYYTQNHEYSIMQTIGASVTGGSSAAYTFELLYLKDNLAVGGTWSAAISNVFTLNGKIVEKGITKKVAGKTFSNVIHTNVVININATGVSGSNVYDIYVAQGVGIIHIDLSYTGSAGVISEDLISYKIN